MRRVALALLVLFLTLVLLPARGNAQLSELQPGARVRLTAPGAIAGRVTGIVIARSSDSISVAVENRAPLSLPLGTLGSIEVSRGKDRLRGAGRGAIWGTAIGLLVGVAVPAECDGNGHGMDCLSDGSRPSTAAYLGTNMTGGAMLGGIIGAIVGVEQWERFGVPVRPTVAANRVGVSLRF